MGGKERLVALRRRPACVKARRRNDLACTGAHPGANTQGDPFGDVSFGEKEELR